MKAQDSFGPSGRALVEQDFRGGCALSEAAPRHEHDCDDCTFLGHHGEYDLYFHEGCVPAMTTVLARYGPGSAYRSGLQFAQPWKDLAGAMRPAATELAEARERAIAAGDGADIAKATGEQG